MHFSLMIAVVCLQCRTGRTWVDVGPVVIEDEDLLGRGELGWSGVGT